jgi:conjugative relaxase-like TrwC/TraI family protein
MCRRSGSRWRGGSPPSTQAAGLPADWAVPAADRARIRTEVAREFFTAEHGRQPEDARELAAAIAKHSRPRTQAVAGYDLTFSPVKSVSALWAVADPSTAAAIERAHRAAVGDALRFIEQHALFTRVGANGVRQVEVRGLVAAAFTHRDSRAGDPDLHTHVAVANKVQTLDGRWLSIDGRILFKATVAASETYNTALENHLRTGLGVRFVERPNPDPRLRPVREIVGVDPTLNTRWSTRRASIQIRRGELAADFQHSHGRPPTPVESLKLAQQATLETRDCQTRTPDPHRTKASVAGPSKPSPRRPPSGTDHGPHRTAPSSRNTGERPAGRGRGRPDLGGDGGTPLDLADLACPGRGAAAGASAPTTSRAE